MRFPFHSNRLLRFLVLIGVTICLAACSPNGHQTARPTSRPAPIYPDYTNVTIPCNIAPLNFLLRGDISALRVVVQGKTDSLVVSGRNKACFPLRKWKQLLEQEKGHTLTVRIAACAEGEWLRYPDFSWQIASDSIDAYLSYRLIEPGYEVWNTIQLCERNIETFEERVIADNNLTDGNCMNCHIQGRQNQSLSLFHLRGEKGGTILNRNGHLRKLSLKNEQMVAPATYGDLHPSGQYAVFSSNIIIPAFHAADNKRLEVYDTASDLVMADFDRNQLIYSPLVSATAALETFPCFSADGQSVFFCTAQPVAQPDSTPQLRYSLCRIAFLPDEGTWGNRIDTLWHAEREKGSVCFPKASPDGRYLLYTVADYGTFPIWHRETDLELMDLQTGQTNRLPIVNSDRSDTYHSWSSNSRWFVFASKRSDGQYGKPYFAYINRKGEVGKPFALPQKDPEHYDLTFKSYNIPELSAYPVPFDAVDIRRVYQQTEAEPFQLK